LFVCSISCIIREQWNNKGDVMPEVSKQMNDDNLDETVIDSLIADLDNVNGFRREQARESLVAIDGPAIEPLSEALRQAGARVRWEAAKALGEIGDARAAPALVEALEDDNAGVRWAAADSLIAIGRKGLGPLLEALMRRSESAWLREGAHHVLRALSRRKTLSDPDMAVLRALEDPEPTLETPEAAFKALAARRKGGR
jgi:HEAT repeat protein